MAIGTWGACWSRCLAPGRGLPARGRRAAGHVGGGIAPGRVRDSQAGCGSRVSAAPRVTREAKEQGDLVQFWKGWRTCD